MRNPILDGLNPVGPRRLPIVKHADYGGKFYFDERLGELRSVTNPHEHYRLNDFELEYYRSARKLKL